MWGLNESQLVVLAWFAIALLAGVFGAVWFWRDARRQRRELAELERKTVPTEPPRMRLARPTAAWAFPMPPPAAKKYVPPVNGTVRVRPGGYVPSRAPERWDLYVPPAPVDIPAIPSAPAVPDFEEYRGGGGRFGGGGATESWPEVERHGPAGVHDSGVHSIAPDHGVGHGSVDVSSGGGDVGGGGFDGGSGGGGPD
jgi:hypothetical protein